MPKTTRPPTNSAAIQSLKDQGFSVKITHFRRNYTGKLVKDSTVRDLVSEFESNYKYSHGFSHAYIWGDISPTGGATSLKLIRGEEEYEVVANCYYKDRFCRRIGVKSALDKMYEQYEIKP